MKKLISVSEVSELIGCSIQQVRNLDDNGELTAEERNGGQRRFNRVKVLAYIARKTANETYVFIGLNEAEDEFEAWKTHALDFCTRNSMPSIEVIDTLLEPLKADPLLLSRHLVAQIIEHKPQNFVICCPDSIQAAALSTVIDVCKLYRINTHCLFGAGRS